MKRTVLTEVEEKAPEVVVEEKAPEVVVEEKAPEVVVEEKAPEVVVEEKAPEDGTILWKKMGGGSLHWNNRIIKPNQTFRARPDDIPEAFRDTIVPLETLPDDSLLSKDSMASFHLEKDEKDENLYNVISRAGKKVNEEPMEYDKAVYLLKQLR